MLSDDEIKAFREQYAAIVIKPFPVTGHQIEVWNEVLWQPTAATISAFLDDPAIPDDVAGPLLGLLAEIGIACSGDVLHGAPLPIDWNGPSMRRWQLRRELDSLADRLTDAQLQMLVFHSHGVLA